MKENHGMIYAKNKITFTSETEEETIYHSLNQAEGSTWMYQLQAFCMFLKAQGYHIDKRIAVIEPPVESTFDQEGNEMLINMFYEQLEEVGWTGEVVSQDSITTN